MMKKTVLLASFFALSATAALAAGAPTPPPPQLPAPKILVINRQAILQFSKVGQDIARQVQGYATQAKNDMAAQSKALQTEGQALQQQIAILAPDAKQKKIDAFQAKEQALQATAQRKEQAIQGGLLNAQHSVEMVLGPILQALMQQRGANMILDKNAVVVANSAAFDITQPAIDQLNQKMSTVKVTLDASAAAPQAPAK
ncbi:MAG TPA: OmpH family outer membrane protein [Rhizomicrobium sp.]|nr:OmpH family outer membrane protein [Rhizomicrobium sp.]